MTVKQICTGWGNKDAHLKAAILFATKYKEHVPGIPARHF